MSRQLRTRMFSLALATALGLMAAMPLVAQVERARVNIKGMT